MISQTSLDAYMQLILDPVRLGANQRIVLDVFEKLVPNQPLSNLDVLHILRSTDKHEKQIKWDINRVTPRILELRKAEKLVQVGYKRQLETGKRVMLWMSPAQWDGTWVDFDYIKGGEW